MSAIRRAVAVVCAALALGAIGGGVAAAAESVHVSPGGSITATSLGRMSFRSALVTVACDVSLAGSLASGLVELTAGTQYGAITSATATNCTSGNTVAFSGLPWTIRYVAIAGELPPGTLTGVGLLLDDASIVVTTPLTGACGYSGDVGMDVGVTGTNPYTTGLADLSASAVVKVSGGILCPSTGALAGTASLTQQQVAAAEVTLAAPLVFTAVNQTKNITITNASTLVPIDVATTSFGGDRPGRFSKPADDPCAPKRIPAGRTCTVPITLNAGPAGIAATFEVHSINRRLVAGALSYP